MKFVLLVSLIAGSVTLNAQIQNGASVLGGMGNAGISFNGKMLEYVGGTIAPEAAYFFVKNASAGLRLSYSGTYYDFRKFGGIKNTSTGVSISPFLRYYFNFGKKFSVFPEVSGGYVYVRDNKNIAYRMNHYWNASLAVGAAYWINDRVAVEWVFRGPLNSSPGFSLESLAGINYYFNR